MWTINDIDRDKIISNSVNNCYVNVVYAFYDIVTARMNT